MNFDMEQYLKKTEEFKNQINRPDTEMAGLIFMQTKGLMSKPGQKIVFETGKNGGMEIQCNASRTVAMIGIYELLNYLDLGKCLNMLAAIHGLKEMDAIETICKGGEISSQEELEVMSALLNKSPEEIEKLKEQLNE